MIGTLMMAAALTANFNETTGRLRPELHSSGFGPQVCSCPPEYVRDIKAMGFKASRTHDWALINPNDRVCDNHHLFPLAHLDPKDPKNYHFAPTDYLFKRTREEVGHEIFFRLGTSIEHSGPKVHFNSLIPDDFERVAENFAATIRHYNRGWANGFNWNIRYWEIWNEPDGFNNMWCLPDGDGGKGDTPEARAADLKVREAKRQALFAKFFAICLKRIKDEFGDSAKVGGPAMCSMRQDYFRSIFAECRKLNVAPDFISWHHYIEDSDIAIDSIAKARQLCNECGYPDCELIINEWHYFGYSDYNWKELRSPDPAIIAKVWTGPRSHNGIDSSVFNLSLLSRFQESALSQGYYYGCRNVGSWGYIDSYQRKYKVFYGLKMFGDFLAKYPVKCKGSIDNPPGPPVATVLAARTADGRCKALLVADFRTRTKELAIKVEGVPADAQVTATMHDYTHNLEPVAVSFKDGTLVIPKHDVESAAYTVEFSNPAVSSVRPVR